MLDKLTVTRNSVLRSRFGGYGRIMEDSVVGDTRYIRKNTVFTVISINLWTDTILAVNQATKGTYSLEYDYIIENCEVIDIPKNTILDSIAIIDTTEEKHGVDWSFVAAMASIFAIFEPIVIAMILYWC